jgi:SAM-dependent methyltransferase
MTFIDRARTVDTVALAYDEVRPRYPEPLFDAVLDDVPQPGEAVVLEIGAGPGVATLPLAQRGHRIVALEPGPALAARARENLAPYPDVEIREATFEQAGLEPGSFDLLVSASAWHWVDPAVGGDLAASAIRPGGKIALWWAGTGIADPEFAAASVAVHGRWVAEDFDPHPMRTRGENIVDHPAFEGATYRSFPTTDYYDTATYLRLLDTYSSYRLLDPDVKAGLFEDLAQLITNQYGGKVGRSHDAVLLTARRR